MSVRNKDWMHFYMYLYMYMYMYVHEHVCTYIYTMYMYNVGLFPNISNNHTCSYIASKVIICSSIHVFKEGYILFMQEDYFLQNSYKWVNEERKYCLTNWLTKVPIFPKADHIQCTCIYMHMYMQLNIHFVHVQSKYTDKSQDIIIETHILIMNELNVLMKFFFNSQFCFII